MTAIGNFVELFGEKNLSLWYRVKLRCNKNKHPGKYLEKWKLESFLLSLFKHKTTFFFYFILLIVSIIKLMFCALSSEYLSEKLYPLNLYA